MREIDFISINIDYSIFINFDINIIIALYIDNILIINPSRSNI